MSERIALTQRQMDSVVIEVELTNRCNASCEFCPRDKMAPYGKMTEADFRLLVARAIETGGKPSVSICGMGDPTLHPELCDFVDYACSQGLQVQVTTNGHLMDPVMARKLVDSGLHRVNFSVTGLGDEYERIYHLPFERVKSNILAFRDIAAGRCKVALSVVNYKEHSQRFDISDVRKYWRENGIGDVAVMRISNRAGSWNRYHHMTLASGSDVSINHQLEGEGFCVIPFQSVYVGWNGHYYLCNHDWQQQVDLGHLSDVSIAQARRSALAYVRQDADICRRCSSYSLNFLRQEGGVGLGGKLYEGEDLVRMMGELDRVAKTLPV